VALLLVSPLSGYFQLIMHQPSYGLLLLSQNLTLAYGPILILIIQHILLQRIKPIRLILHALPFSLLLLLIATDLYQYLVNPPILLASIIFIQVFSYIAYALVILKRHKKHLMNITKHHKNSTYYWLLFLIIGLFAVMVMDCSIWLLIIMGIQPELTIIKTIASMMGIYISCIALFALYQPDIFTHQKYKKEEPSLERKPTHTIRNVELSPEAAHALEQQLDALVTKYKPHLDSEISLTKLASLLGVTRNQLSELLNNHKQVSFYDFLNNLRYNESIHLLENKKMTLSITDIAYRAGFNNKNSFYKVFKLKAGLTPTEYRKRKTA
jgi:AraC-like DNA-binding protein